MKHWIWTILIVAIGEPSLAAAPSPLEQALIGRRIMVPFDVPVSSYGVDFDGDRGLLRDDASRLERLDMWGMALRGGELATITEVRVSKKRIEIVLDRGGLSTTDLMRLYDPRLNVGGGATTAEDTGPHSTHAETREAQRERIMIDGELGGPAESRATDAQISRAVADTTGRAEASRIRAEAWTYRPGLGSRLRILFKEAVPEAMLEPKALMIALSEHVMFVKEASDEALLDAPPDPPRPVR
jgi:hypothetical protein